MADAAHDAEKPRSACRGQQGGMDARDAEVRQVKKQNSVRIKLGQQHNTSSA